MEQNARLSRADFARNGADRQPQRPLSALVTVPVVVVGAACMLPMAVAAFGASRLVQGRFEGLGTDSVAAGRALWRATGVVLDVLTSPAAPRE